MTDANIDREQLRVALRNNRVRVPQLAAQCGVDIAVIELFLTSNAEITAELRGRLAAVLASTERKKISAPSRTTERKPMPPTLTAKALKCTLVLDAKELDALPHPSDRDQRIVFQIAVAAGRNLTADISAKSVRKCKKVIAENGVENTTLILQGRLTDGSVVHDAGLAAQVKVKAAEVQPDGG
jgi:hypothetical protein